MSLVDRALGRSSAPAEMPPLKRIEALIDHVADALHIPDYLSGQVKHQMRQMSPEQEQAFFEAGVRLFEQARDAESGDALKERLL